MAYKQLLPELAEELSKKGYERAQVSILSSQLRNGLQRKRRAASIWALHVPHYWAVYVHDGRGPATPKNAAFLVWFRNPRNDPRLNNGRSPERLAQTRRLSSSQFKYWSAKNREIVKRYRRRTGKKILTSSDYEAMQLPMIVAKMSPKGGGKIPGQRFFGNAAGEGMAGFKEEASRIAVRMTSNHVRAELDRVGLLRKKKTIRI